MGSLGVERAEQGIGTGAGVQLSPGSAQLRASQVTAEKEKVYE